MPKTPEEQRELQQQIAAMREARFQDILDGYEADGPDCTVPGAARIGKYAVVTESTRGHGYFVNYARDRAAAEQVAAANIDEAWQPVCVYDLDVLAGDEPIIMEGDRVRYDGEERIVSHHDYEASEGEPYPVVYLEAKPGDAADGTRAGWQPEGPIDPDNADLKLVERAQPDERMPVRYAVAAVRTIVVFDTVPSP